MSAPASALVARYREALARPEAPDPDAPLVVALSGGVDSCTLLHLLRFVGSRRLLVAAHFDHAMREDSAADARWVRGLCRAWEVPLATERARIPPRTEEEARRARYDFLEEVRRERGAPVVATAHHADDQAETVLFRAFRGTGLGGLAGIRRARDGRVWRPLLDVRRADIVAYARARRLGWREDPTNASLDRARNAIRHGILPVAERYVSPSAVRSLARLAEQAAHEEEGWASLTPWLLDAVGVERTDDGTLSLDREGLAHLHPAVRARVLRAAGAELGARPRARATAEAVAFAAEAPSGRAIDLGGSLTLRRELDRLVLERASRTDAVGARPGADPGAAERPLRIPGPGAGSGEAVIGGRRFRVAWGASLPGGAERTERFDPGALGFPLTVRGWAAGDRIRARGGTRKLKKAFLEARIPARERHAVPIVADASGTVVWVAGIARADDVAPRGATAFGIGIAAG